MVDVTDAGRRMLLGAIALPGPGRALIAVAIVLARR